MQRKDEKMLIIAISWWQNQKIFIFFFVNFDTFLISFNNHSLLSLEQKTELAQETTEYINKNINV